MRRIGSALLSLAVFLVLWKLVTVVGDLPEYILPAPEVVVERGARAIGSGVLWPHVGVTLLEIVLGFAVGAAVAIGVGHRPGQERLRRARPVAEHRRGPGDPIPSVAPPSRSGFGGGLSARGVVLPRRPSPPRSPAPTTVGIRSTDPLLLDETLGQASAPSPTQRILPARRSPRRCR